MEPKLQFSFFYDTEKGIKNTTPKAAKDFKQLIAIYKSSKLEQLTKELQNASKEDKPRIKLQLPFFTPYGTFSQRNNESILHHNSNIVALDFDGLDSPNTKKLKRKLTINKSVLLACISPRGNGVKALVLLDGNTTPGTHYNALKFNSDRICANLGIYDYKDFCDRAQFVLCQPMFFAFDPELYVNEYARPLLKLKPYEAPPIDYQERTILEPSFQSSRIEQYLLNASNRLYSELISTKEGTRHHSIIKVQKIASWLHYAPHLETEIKTHLHSAVVFMYGGHKSATEQNALKSFAGAWGSAPQNANPTIESIINDIQTAAK